MGTELPLGFGMALARDEAAMQQFEHLSGTEKQAVLRQARHVRSKEEMRQLVSGLSAGRPTGQPLQ